MPDTVEARAVLDCSAVLSYARGHVHVGELLVEIADEDAFVGLPALDMLDALPVVAVLPLGSYEAAEVAPIVPLVKGDMSRAHAVWAALEDDAYYVTVEPHLLPKMMADIKLITISAEDA